MKIRPVPPFDFGLTVGYQAFFEGKDVSATLWQGRQVYQRVMRIGERLVLVSVHSEGTVESPELIVHVRHVQGGGSLSENDQRDVIDQLGWLLGVEQELETFYSLAKENDSTMWELTRRFRGLHIPRSDTVFETLALAILGHFNNPETASYIRSRLMNEFGTPLEFEGETWRLFPRPEIIRDAEICDLINCTGRPENIIERLKGVAEAATRNSMESFKGESDDNKVVTRIEEIKGAKKWTAQWVLLRGLGRPDALPLGESPQGFPEWPLQRQVSRFYGYTNKRVTNDEVRKVSQHWRPYRSYGVTYLLADHRSMEIPNPPRKHTTLGKTQKKRQKLPQPRLFP